MIKIFPNNIFKIFLRMNIEYSQYILQLIKHHVFDSFIFIFSQRLIQKKNLCQICLEN